MVLPTTLAEETEIREFENFFHSGDDKLLTFLFLYSRQVIHMLFALKCSAYNLVLLTKKHNSKCVKHDLNFYSLLLIFFPVSL